MFPVVVFHDCGQLLQDPLSRKELHEKIFGNDVVQVIIQLLISCLVREEEKKESAKQFVIMVHPQFDEFKKMAEIHQDVE